MKCFIMIDQHITMDSLDTDPHIVPDGADPVRIVGAEPTEQRITLTITSRSHGDVPATVQVLSP